MAKKFNEGDWEKSFEEIKSESDRAAVIVSSALLENALERSIISRLIPMSNTHRDLLFEDPGPISTFSAKIKLGFSLGLYGHTAKSDLNKIRAIRNQFAHQLARDFAHEEVAKLCESMTHYNPDPHVDVLVKTHISEPHAAKIVMRWKYMFAIMHLMDGIIKEGQLTQSPPLPVHLP
jgi:DNA-binding MltR family transcriptional regulator